MYANWQNRTRSLIASAGCFLLRHFEREEGNSLEAPTRLQSKLPKARVGLFALAEWNAHDCPGATIAMAHEVAVVHVAARVSWLIVGCLMSSAVACHCVFSLATRFPSSRMKSVTEMKAPHIQRKRRKKTRQDPSMVKRSHATHMADEASICCGPKSAQFLVGTCDDHHCTHRRNNG